MEVEKYYREITDGIVRKKSGEIVIGGIPLTEETLNQVRSQIGIVFKILIINLLVRL